MSVKIEVVRGSDFGRSSWPRPWSVGEVDDDGEWPVLDSDSAPVGWWSDKAEARAIVDAVNAIQPRKGKIEKFVVEMDPDTFRAVTAVMGLFVHEAGHDFWNEARPFIEFKTPRSGEPLRIGPRELILDAIAGTTIKEDA